MQHERAPRNDEPIEDYVFVWKQMAHGHRTGNQFAWVRVHYTKAVCAECDEQYNADWWWDADSNGDPMLVCNCGGQMYSTLEEFDCNAP